MEFFHVYCLVTIKYLKCFSESSICCTGYYIQDGICKSTLCLIKISLIFFFQFHLTNKIWSKRWFCNSFIIECFGAVGPNCSIPCESNFFGYLCKNQCDCQKDEICNRYFGCSELHFKVARLYCWKFLFKENLFEKA